MTSLYDSIKTFWAKPATFVKEPISTLYNERIKCFQTLIALQKNLELSENEYINVSIIEGKTHTNALSRMEAYNAKYKKEYTLCEKIIKP